MLIRDTTRLISLHFVYVGAVKGFTHWREGRPSGHEPYAGLVNFLSYTDTVFTAGVLHHKIGIYKNKEEK